LQNLRNFFSNEPVCWSCKRLGYMYVYTGHLSSMSTSLKTTFLIQTAPSSSGSGPNTHRLLGSPHRENAT